MNTMRCKVRISSQMHAGVAAYAEARGMDITSAATEFVRMGLLLMELRTPGSPGGVLAGCTCGPDDNRHGLGYAEFDGQPAFAVSSRCPLHNRILKQEQGSESVRTL